jgi:hypothetical protein
MIYQQPPKPSRLLNNNDNNKRSPPNLQHIQVIYDSTGNTDHVIYHSPSHKSSLIEEDNNMTSSSRRPLLEEKRSIDAKVHFTCL